MKPEQGNRYDTLSASPEQTGGPVKPGENAIDRSPEAFSKPEAGRAESNAQRAPSPGRASPREAVGAAPRQASFRSKACLGDAWSTSSGASVHDSEEAGVRASPEMPVYSNPGAAQQVGPIPGPDLHYGHYTYNPGYYGGSAFDSPIGGPQPWAHPRPGHHERSFAHHAGIDWQPPQGPHFGAPGGHGFGYAEAPPHSNHGEERYGQFADMVGKALQGQATPGDLLSGLLNLNFRDDQFWKGVVVGSVAALLFNSESVRDALSGALWGVFGKAADTAQAEDQHGEKTPGDTNKRG